jgi:hypothetical protein
MSMVHTSSRHGLCASFIQPGSCRSLCKLRHRRRHQVMRREQACYQIVRVLLRVVGGVVGSFLNMTGLSAYR